MARTSMFFYVRSTSPLLPTDVAADVQADAHELAGGQLVINASATGATKAGPGYVQLRLEGELADLRDVMRTLGSDYASLSADIIRVSEVTISGTVMTSRQWINTPDGVLESAGPAIDITGRPTDVVHDQATQALIVVTTTKEA